MLQLYTYTCKIITTHNKRRGKTSLKNIPLTLLSSLRVRGSWRPKKTATYWPSLLWPSALCLTRSPGLINWRPEGPAFCWVLFSLPHLVSNSFDLQIPDFLSSPNYVIGQSPTQSMEWHVRSSSSENNCHAVQRSLSSGASVYDCTMGFYLFSLWNGMFGRVEGQYTTIHNSESRDK